MTCRRGLNWRTVTIKHKAKSSVSACFVTRWILQSLPNSWTLPVSRKLTAGLSAHLLLYLLGGWDRNHLLEEFCFWYPRKFIITNTLLRNLLIVTPPTEQLRFYCWPRWKCFYTCYIGNDDILSYLLWRIIIRFCGNMITETLTSNGRLAETPLLRLSGVMSQYACNYARNVYRHTKMQIFLIYDMAKHDREYKEFNFGEVDFWLLKRLSWHYSIK